MYDPPPHELRLMAEKPLYLLNTFKGTLKTDLQLLFRTTAFNVHCGRILCDGYAPEDPRNSGLIFP
jgi:hypothetical protein